VHQQTTNSAEQHICRFLQPLSMSGRYGSSFTVYLPPLYTCQYNDASRTYVTVWPFLATRNSEHFCLKKCLYWYFFFWQI